MGISMTPSTTSRMPPSSRRLDRRSTSQLLANQRSYFGTEELDRAHGQCMIDMSGMHLKTINAHDFMQSDDLLRHRFGIAEEQGALRGDQLFDRRVCHRRPA